MKKLLSLPTNLINYFHEIEDKNRDEWICATDPENTPLGSGGSTTW
ncbi:hypothetical protein [Aureibaculum luteum]|nr:hypothetical protein [Aureibaculum luteum]